LDELQLNPLRGNSESGIGENKYVTGYSDDGRVISDDSELVRRLSENFEYMFQQTDSITLSGLTAHLKEEFPSMGRKNIESYALQDPFNFIKKINLLIHRGIIKGKCEICEGL
jgi:Mg2+/Co2+ transporter CorB